MKSKGGCAMLKCLTCKHCKIDFGSPGYSELTPGEEGYWYCAKKVWRMGSYDGKQELKDALVLGEACQLWKSDGREQPKSEGG